MAKVTKVFDLKTKIKFVIDVPEGELELMVKEAADVYQSGVCEGKVTKAQWYIAASILEAAATKGIDGVLEASLRMAYRDAFREGQLDLGLTDEVTMSPPTLSFKR